MRVNLVLGLVYDCRKNEEELEPEKIIRICARKFGIGADGIVAGPYMQEGQMHVKVYNADGSEAEQGGNAIRIFAHYLKSIGEVQRESFSLFTKSGEVEIRFLNREGTRIQMTMGRLIRIFAHYLKSIGEVQRESFSLFTKSGEVEIRFLNREGTRIQMTMGRLSFSSKKLGLSGPDREAVHEYFNFGGEEYDCTCVSTGNPHCVMITEDISRAKICGIGKYSECADYFPDRTNTIIVKILDKNNIQIEIFER